MPKAQTTRREKHRRSPYGGPPSGAPAAPAPRRSSGRAARLQRPHLGRADRRIDRPLLLLTAASARPGASRRFGSWSGLGRVAQARLHRRPLGRHPVVQPRRALPAHLTPGLCRRSPAACDRWHIRQPVPAARLTAVLPRGSSGGTAEPPEPAGGRGHSGRIGVRGGRRPRGGRREPGVRSGRWRCRSGARSPTARDPSASLPRPAPSRPERAWPLVPGTRIGRPSPNQHLSCTLQLSPSEVPKGRAERACP